jgi:hypothetical protein
MSESGSLSTWKKIALRSFFGGVGIAVALAAIAGGWLWYESRPTPPKPWNTHAIVSTEPPTFYSETWVSKDGKTTRPIVVFRYTLQNKTEIDYKIENRSDLKWTARMDDGAVTPDFLSDHTDPTESYPDDITLPIFVPAKQKSFILFHIADNDLPKQKTGESGDDFHERLRTYLNNTYSFTGFVFFDDSNRFEIDVPRWQEKSNAPAETLAPCLAKDPLGLNQKSKCAPLPGK